MNYNESVFAQMELLMHNPVVIRNKKSEFK